MQVATELYCYRALVTDVYDGDTITVNIDLGLDIWLMNQKIRFWGIDAPEIRISAWEPYRTEEKQKGHASRDYLRTLILGKKVILRTKQDEKGSFQRWLAIVYLDGVDINADLVDKGYAKYKDY